MTHAGGVLMMTDLTPAAERALVVAGRIAEHCDVSLDIVYALGLRGLPLRAAVPDLLHLDQRISSIDRSVRDLVCAHLPNGHCTTGPAIDVDTAPVALIRRVRQLAPLLVVIPSPWTGDREGAPPPDDPATLAAFSAPVLLVGSGDLDSSRAMFLSNTTLSSTFLQSAWDWVVWIQAIARGRALGEHPSVDVVMAGGEPWPWNAAPMDDVPGIVVVPKSALAAPSDPVTRSAVAALLTRHSTHVLILPETSTPPLFPEPGRGGVTNTPAGTQYMNRPPETVPA